MPKHVTLLPHLSSAELERRYRSAHEPHERSSWQILWLLSRGQSARQVAESTRFSAYWIGQLAERYNTEVPSGMCDRAHTDSYRRPRLLKAALHEELRTALQGPTPARHTLWMARLVAARMGERLGRPVAVQRSRESRLKLPGSVTSSRKEYRGVLIPSPARWLESGVLSQARPGGIRGSRQASLQARLQPPAPPKRQHPRRTWYHPYPEEHGHLTY